jgi:hypothetical protein
VAKSLTPAPEQTVVFGDLFLSNGVAIVVTLIVSAAIGIYLV